MRGAIVVAACLLLGACSTTTGFKYPTYDSTEALLAQDVPPARIASLDDLPESVRAAALAHMQSRAGPFAPRLTFAGGRYYDPARVRSEARKIQDRDPPAYVLQWRFGEPAAIEDYAAQLRLRADGSILHPLELPDFGARPEQMGFVGLDRIYDAVRAEGFSPRVSDLQLGYDAGTDAIVWRVIENKRRNNIETLRSLTISAHDASVLERGAVEIMH